VNRESNDHESKDKEFKDIHELFSPSDSPFDDPNGSVIKLKGKATATKSSYWDDLENRVENETK